MGWVAINSDNIKGIRENDTLKYKYKSLWFYHKVKEKELKDKFIVVKNEFVDGEDYSILSPPYGEVVYTLK
jgi:hypothetical protein